MKNKREIKKIRKEMFKKVLKGKHIEFINSNEFIKELLNDGVIKTIYVDGDQDINIELGYNALINVDADWNFKFRIPSKVFKYGDVNHFTHQITDEFGGDEFTNQTFVINLMKLISHLHEELEEIIMYYKEGIYFRCPELNEGFRVDVWRCDHFNEYETTVGLYNYWNNLSWTTFSVEENWFAMNTSNEKFQQPKYHTYKYNWDRSVNF